MTDHSSCSVDPDELSAFMDEELPERRMADLREHVRDCPQCDERLSRLRETQRVARLADAPGAPDSFVSDVRDRIQADTGAEAGSGGSSDTTGTHDASAGAPSGDDEKRSLFPSPVSRAAAAVVLVGISVGLLVLFWPTGQTPERAADRQVTMEEVPQTDGVAEPESSQEGTGSTAERTESQIDGSEEKPPSSTADAGQGASEPEQLAPQDGDASDMEQEQTADRNEFAKKPAEQTESTKQKSMTSSAGAASGSSGSGGPRTPEPLHVRLTGDLSDVPDQLAAALEAMDPDRVTVRVTGTDTGQEQSSSGFAGAGSTEARRLALDAGVKQIAQVLNSDARLELVMPETEARLFLGALVQQGRSPRLLTADEVRTSEEGGIAGAYQAETKSFGSQDTRTDDEEQDEDSKEGAGNQSMDPELMASLQRVNLQLQESRSEWRQDDDSGSAATDGSIALPALRRFLDRYRESEEHGDLASGNRIQEQDAGDEDVEDTSASQRRTVLREWIHLLERRPSSWSAGEQEADQVRTRAQSQEQDQSRASTDHVDVILHVQTPDRSPVEAQKDE